MEVVLPGDKRKALKELLDAAVTRSDMGSITPRALSSRTRSMQMLIHPQTRGNGLEERVKVSIPTAKIPVLGLLSPVPALRTH